MKQQSLDDVLAKLKKPPKKVTQKHQRKKSPIEEFYDIHKTSVKQSPQTNIYNPPITHSHDPNSNTDTISQPQYSSILKGLTFVLLPYGFTLTHKRVEIFESAIRNRGGHIIPHLQFKWATANPVDHFIIITRTMKYSSLLMMVPKDGHGRLADFNFIDCEWLSECFKQDKFLNPKNYFVYFEELYGNKENIPIAELRIESPIRIEIIKESPVMTPQFGVKSRDVTENNDEIETIDETIPISLKEMLVIPKKSKIKHNKILMQQTRTLYDYNYGFEIHEVLENNPVEWSAILERGSDIMSDEELLEAKFPLGVRSEDRKGFEVSQQSEQDIDPEELIQKKIWDPEENDYMEPFFSPKIEFPGNIKEKHTLLEATSHENYNVNITEPLERILMNYEANNDSGRVHAYRRAIASIKSFSKKIMRAEEVKGLYGIGPKIYEKIKEILQTGQLQQAERLAEDQKTRIIEEFMRVYGMGVETSHKLYLEGCRSIEDLRRNQLLLNNTQKLGLKYYDDFLMKTPRQEVDLILNVIHDAVIDISEKIDAYEMVCCGSYRRGRLTVGDIDLLFSRKDGKQDPIFLHNLVTKLIKKAFLVDHFVLPKTTETERRNTYMGVIKWKRHYIKLDMLFYPRTSLAYGLLAWTGSGNYVRELRRLAKQKGLHLEDHGMYYNADPSGRVKGILCDSEEEIFKILGLEYKRPEDRDL